MLGLANLIHFLSDPRKKPLAQDIYKLSLHPTQVSFAHTHTHTLIFTCTSSNKVCYVQLHVCDTSVVTVM